MENKTYTQHSKQQRERIMEKTKLLFCNNGFKIQLSTIAKECHMTRVTLYKYFDNKEDILWAILHDIFQNLGASLEPYHNCTGYEHYKFFFKKILELSQEAPASFIFMQKFFKVYQSQTSSVHDELYQKYFKNGDFGRKDTASFLIENFYDGSIRKDLNDRETSVSAVYMALFNSIDFIIFKENLALKYNLNAHDTLKNIFQIFLNGIKNTK